MAAHLGVSLALALPYLVQRGVAWTVSAPLTYQGATATVTSGTVSVLRPDGTALVSAAAVTVASGVASYALTATAAEALGPGWEVRWTLTSGGVAYTLVHGLVLCEYVPPCTVGHDQLYTLLPELRDRVPAAQSAVGWQPQVSRAYEYLLQRLLDDGRPVHYLRSVVGAHPYLEQQALLLCLEAIGDEGEGSMWAPRIRATRARALEARGAMALTYSSEPGLAQGARPLTLSPAGRW